jgi:uncharacterized protein YerC
MIFLNLNREYISAFLGLNANFVMGTFIALFSGFTLYYLGTLANKYLHDYTPLPSPIATNDLANLGVSLEEEKEEQEAINDLMTEIETAAYLKKYENVVNDLQGGLSILKTASKNGVSKSTVQNVKRVLSNTITAIVV